MRRVMCADFGSILAGLFGRILQPAPAGSGQRKADVVLEAFLFVFHLESRVLEVEASRQQAGQSIARWPGSLWSLGHRIARHATL
jgi:hypothetical protein